MNITDYIIDIRDSTLAERIKLRQVLLDNGEDLRQSYGEISSIFTCVDTHWDYFMECKIDFAWTGANIVNPNITLADFITKFTKQPRLRNLAVRKLNGTWTTAEANRLFEFVGDGINPKDTYDDVDDWFYDSGEEPLFMGSTGNPEPHLLQLYYEDLFPEPQLLHQEETLISSINDTAIAGTNQSKGNIMNNTPTQNAQDIAAALEIAICSKSNKKAKKVVVVKTELQLRKPITTKLFKKKQFGGELVETKHFNTDKPVNSYCETIDNFNRYKVVVSKETEVISNKLELTRTASN